jgi:hypothetical protein
MLVGRPIGECEGALAAGAQVDVRGIAEPAADLAGFGYHAPDGLHRRLDQDLSLDNTRDHCYASSDYMQP